MGSEPYHVIVRPVVCRPFVGRLEELAYLRERRREAGSSRGGIVFIAGDAGLGKTRLITEFCRSLAYSRWRIAYGACTEFAGRPYGPLLDALTRLDSEAATLAPAESKHEQFDAIVERLATIAGHSATVVVIEDLHWADAATLDLLTYLAPKLQRMRALIVASFRPDALHPEHPASGALTKLTQNAHAARIDLVPLAGSELRTFIDEALTDLALPDETRRAIALAGEGNPFFTEELLKSAVEHDTKHVGERRRQELPHTVRAVLLERLSPFDSAERQVVTQAAVIGRTFDLNLLAATFDTEPERLLPALRRARDFQLIEEIRPTLFRFRHGLTRQAIYSDFLGAELRPLHRTIALTLEQAPEDERSTEGLAYHWWAAGDDARSSHYNELAGDAAVRVHAYEDAIALYERALEARTLDPIVRGSIMEKIAESRIALRSSDEARATFEAAAEIFRKAGAHDREAACRSQAAIFAYITGMPAPTAQLEATLERLDPGEYLARSRIHLGLAWLAATFGFPTEAARHLDQVDPHALKEADINLRFYNVSAWVAMTFGDVDRFRDLHAIWLEAARASNSVRLLNAALVNGAMCLSFFGLHDEALENIDRALRLAREANNRHAEDASNAFAAMCHLLRGDLHAARRAVETLSPATEDHVNATFATSWGLITAAHLDDTAMIDKWFAQFEASNERKLEVECGAGLAEILVRRGRHAEAADVLHRAIPDCEFLRGNTLTLLAVGRYGAATDRERARAYLVRAAEGPADSLERPALALFDAFCRHREGDPSTAATLARRAADGFRSLHTPLLEAAAREIAGERDAALAIYRRCGAVYDVHRLDGSTPTARNAIAVVNERAASLLSAREREVALLAARGQSNLEIAQELSISHKTVEKHLGSAFQKLGLSSRRDLRSIIAN